MEIFMQRQNWSGQYTNPVNTYSHVGKPKQLASTQSVQTTKIVVTKLSLKQTSDVFHF